jgi:hypothetical protein
VPTPVIRAAGAGSGTPIAALRMPARIEIFRFMRIPFLNKPT